MTVILERTWSCV